MLSLWPLIQWGGGGIAGFLSEQILLKIKQKHTFYLPLGKTFGQLFEVFFNLVRIHLCMALKNNTLQRFINIGAEAYIADTL